MSRSVVRSLHAEDVDLILLYFDSEPGWVQTDKPLCIVVFSMIVHLCIWNRLTCHSKGGVLVVHHRDAENEDSCDTFVGSRQQCHFIDFKPLLPVSSKQMHHCFHELCFGTVNTVPDLSPLMQYFPLPTSKSDRFNLCGDPLSPKIFHFRFKCCFILVTYPLGYQSVIGLSLLHFCGFSCAENIMYCANSAPHLPISS